jgi:hypothetical protein
MMLNQMSIEKKMWWSLWIKGSDTTDVTCTTQHTIITLYANPSGHAVWGIGLDHLDAEMVGLNPA